MYAEGADIVYPAAGLSGLGVFEAANEAGAPGEMWAIGVDSDQYHTAAPTVQPYILTSMLKRVDIAVYETIKAEVDGTFAGWRSRSSTSPRRRRLRDVGRLPVGRCRSPSSRSSRPRSSSGEIVVPTDPAAA